MIRSAINENMRQDLTLLRDELSFQIVDHEQRLALLEAGGGAEMKQPAAKVSSRAPAQPVASSKAATPSGESAPELYERALKTIREQRIMLQAVK